MNFRSTEIPTSRWRIVQILGAFLVLAAAVVSATGCTWFQATAKEHVAVAVEAAADAESKSLQDRYPDIAKGDTLDVIAKKISAAEGKKFAAKLAAAKDAAEAAAAAKEFAQSVAAGIGAAGAAAGLNAFVLWLRGKKWRDAFLTVAGTIETAGNSAVRDDVAAAGRIKEMIATAAPAASGVGNFILNIVKSYVEKKV